jgi:hypothetical protein
MALTFDDKQAAELLETLGLPTNTTDIAVALATAKDAVANGGPADLQPSAIVAAAKAAGLEAMDVATAEALRAEAAEGRQIKATVARQRIEETVTNAVQKGKITPARKDHWINLLTADPGMGEMLNNLPDEMAVPFNEIGHSVSNEDGSPNIPADQWQW